MEKMKNMLELLRTRRSIRKFQDRAIEQEKLEELLKAALLAPSSRSRRPWEFVVITDKKLLKDLSECRESSSQLIGNAPLAIVVVANPELCDVWIEDCSIAATLIQITAHSLGLGSCWVQVRERFSKDQQKAEDYVMNLLDIPSDLNVECIIAIGYPAEEKKPYELNELLYNKIHRESY